MSYTVGLIGVWICSDAMYSLALYLGKPSWRGGEPQTWLRDHWVRTVRLLCGISLVAIGAVFGG